MYSLKDDQKWQFAISSMLGTYEHDLSRPCQENVNNDQ